MKKCLVLMLMFGLIGYANAVTLFVDDFEGKANEDWVFTNLEGKGIWEIDNVDGMSVYKCTSIGAWTGAAIGGIASLADYDEIWATCKFKAEQDIGSCNELGLLIDPNALAGNWYLSTCEGGSEIGIDEAGIAWHARIPFVWELGEWYNLKIMVDKDGTMYGKMWLVDDKEPNKWLTQETLTTHLDQDGVGLVSYHCITYFDDVIVASSEDSLVPMAVSMNGKLATTWGNIKY